MTANNYSAWTINSEEFSNSWPNLQKLEFFARYAILAPSGHNTQPWLFHPEGDALILRAAAGRSLPYSGLKANEPLVSLGSCLGTLKLAASGFGYTLDIQYGELPDNVATITISGETSPDSTLLNAITSRVSNRSIYKAEAVSDSILKPLLSTDLKKVSLHSFSKKDDVAFFAQETVKATTRVMGDKEFRAELSKWVRNNLTKQFDGMPGFVQGIPTPPSLLAKHLIKNVDISKDQAKKDSQRMLHTPNVVVITIADSSSEALLNAGSAYAEFCVKAQQQGLATSGLGTAVIDPISRKNVEEKFALPGQAVAIIRLGKATENARHTPRWPFASVTV